MSLLYTVLRHILLLSFGASVSNEQPLAEKTGMSSSHLNTLFDTNAP